MSTADNPLRRVLPSLDNLPDFAGSEIQIVGSIPVCAEWQHDIEAIAQARTQGGQAGTYRVTRVRNEDKQLTMDRKGAAAEYVIRELVETWGIVHQMPVEAAAFVADKPVQEGDIGIGTHLFDVKGCAGKVAGVQDREDQFVTVNQHLNDVSYPALGIEGYFVGRLTDTAEGRLLDVFYVPRAAVAATGPKAATRPGAGPYYEVRLPRLFGKL